MTTKSRTSRRSVAFYDVILLAIVVIAIRMLIERILPQFYSSFNLYFSDFLFDLLSNFPLTIFMVVADFLLVYFLVKKFPYGRRFRIRSVLELLGIILIAFLSTLLLKVTNGARYDPGGPMFEKFMFFIFFTSIIFNLVVVLFLDILSYYRWSHKKSLDMEVRKRSQTNYQYNMLKGQLNPHFLFNSLNVLDYLIYTDQKRASDYVKKLAALYRYLLNIENKPIVKMEEEIEFIQSYTDLLKERFTKGLEVMIDIPETYYESKVIPGAIQLMLENAVKHNIVSSSNILRIDIFIEDNKIVVKNNKQLKNNPNNSTGLGLKNIDKQYRILFGKSTEIEDGDDFFEVRIPIID